MIEISDCGDAVHTAVQVGNKSHAFDISVTAEMVFHHMLLGENT